MLQRLGWAAGWACLLAIVLIAQDGQTAFAQGGFGFSQAVGGISIDASGLVRNAEVDALNQLHAVRARAMADVPGDLRAAQPLRKVSLRRIEEETLAARQRGESIGEAMQYLAGLQSIRYVIVYPDRGDIVLVGFAEGWKVDDRGNVVGLTTGKPVLMLDDLLVALRSVRGGRGRPISCSIDPRAEGLRQLREFVSTLSDIGDPATTVERIEKLLGPQTVSLAGVSPTSHLARVLVAADYRMKRLGMGFDQAPVPGMPSYLQMIKASGRGMQNMTPRWWMVPNFLAPLVDAEGLTFELRGGSVKTLTEETFFADNGARNTQTGKVNPTAQRWADNMTARYDDLAAKEPIFAELSNCMTLFVVAALVVDRQLPMRAGHDFSPLFDAEQVPTSVFDAPRQIDTQANLIKKGNNWVISASGGVKIEPKQLVSRLDPSESLGGVRGSAEPAPTSYRWWWN
jgi:hypothetical protein